MPHHITESLIHQLRRWSFSQTSLQSPRTDRRKPPGDTQLTEAQSDDSNDDDVALPTVSDQRQRINMHFSTSGAAKVLSRSCLVAATELSSRSRGGAISVLTENGHVWVISKETVENSWDILYAINRSQMSSESSSHTKRINPKFATESAFYHICVLQCAYAPFRHLIWI